MASRLVRPVLILLLTASAVTSLAVSTASAPPPLSDVGRWSEPFEGGVPAVNMILLHDGSVLYYSGNEGGDQDWVYFLNATLEGQARAPHPPYSNTDVAVPGNEFGGEGDLFCSGDTVLSDGRVLVVGGTEGRTLPDLATPLTGLDDVRIFDPSLGTDGAFTDASDMRWNRWYPSAIALSDGRALVASGIGDLTNPAEQWPQVEVYGADGQWTYLHGADNFLPLYPRLFLVPGGPLKGQVLYSTVGTLWGTFGEHPLEARWNLQQSLDISEHGISATDELVGARWTVHGPSVFGVRQHANVVPLLLDPDRDYAPELLTFGGSLNRGIAATPLVEKADLAGIPALDVPIVNTPMAPMHYPRWHGNGVLLPSGEVLAIGGGLYDNVVVHGQRNVGVLPAESFDPSTGTWTELAPMQVNRTYHSTAVLLPDGRVLVGGHVPLAVPWTIFRDNAPMDLEKQIAETRLEIFEPPYLFRGARPTIDAVSDTDLTFSEEFDVTTTDAASATAVLMRPSSTTHAFDADQRGILLEGTADGSTLTLVAPPDGTVAPPGWYMLFLVKDNGAGPTPSVATWVHVG